MCLFLDSLDDDTLLGVFSALTVPDVLNLRQTCRRLLVFSSQRIVWQNIGSSQILQQGIPFSKKPLSSFPVRDLEDRVRRAYHLGKAWKAPSITFRASGFAASNGSPIQDIYFIPGHDRRWLITVSQGIWSMIILWDRRNLKRVTSWSPQKAVFSALAVNTSEDCEAALAVSLHRYDSVVVEILAIASITPDSPPGFECIARLDTLRQPIAMCGSLLALADDESETIIWNWKTQEYAVLQSPVDADLWRNKCTQVVFAYKTILVVRARSVHAFTEPKLAPHSNTCIHHPYAQSTFGWVDGIFISVPPSSPEDPTGMEGQPLSILVRTKNDDPWSSTFKMQLWTLSPMTSPYEATVDGPHYIFPPSMTSEIVTPRRGALRCTDMVLGPHGTAVWVQPEDYSVAGLISSSVHLQNMPVPQSHETLVAAAFPGLLNTQDKSQVKSSWKNYGKDWTCLDYDEERGCVALGSAAGAVTILDI
ncbi:hypothetical protein DFJ58DRAFT_788846 [Suillus subalutaceus]|uniref:uncharacterized protein n=1 Tax=Suillus subalutaceus TaxID=48586 RepID=UPI001B878225|nr:uncharacterized protein DFJ58DRAFT_788846 [Suillus subalutaceus]KAG1853898.1 hypothetical protein DFJ58DRAFT_788846 [Suillus subalutaceus]